MHYQQQDKVCPVCNQPFAEKAVIESGMRWGDVFPGTVFDFFNRHDMRCSSTVNVTDDGEQEQLYDGEVAVYFHDLGGEKLEIQSP